MESAGQLVIGEECRTSTRANGRTADGEERFDAHSHTTPRAIRRARTIAVLERVCAESVVVRYVLADGAWQIGTGWSGWRSQDPPLTQTLIRSKGLACVPSIRPHVAHPAPVIVAGVTHGQLGTESLRAPCNNASFTLLSSRPHSSQS